MKTAKMKTRDAQKAALDASLRGMFGKLQARPMPDSLLQLIDDLEEADVPQVKAAAGARL